MDTYAEARKKIRSLPILLLLVAACSQPPSVALEEVDTFGSNPGDLRMLVYVPPSLDPGVRRLGSGDSSGQGSGRGVKRVSSPGVPLVVALHGCTQDAQEYAENSGWARLADRWGFLLLLPEQRHRNNLPKCFNWFSPEDSRRDSGEALSIRQMVDRMQRDYRVDPQRIYVTGISAGAAMTMNLAADYPDVFAGAAPVAGIPFGCADGFLSALGCMWDPPDKDAVEWGAEVHSATDHQGPWPSISVWQGEADSAVDPANAEAIVSQWTNVHGIGSKPDEAHDLKGHVHSLYRDSSGRVLVESYRINGMGHGVPVDPGPGGSQCGKAARFFPDADVCSSFRIAEFWGLAPRPVAGRGS